MQGIEVIRCPLWVPKHFSNLNRLLHLLTFALSSFPAVVLQVLRHKPDLIMCVIPTLFSAPTTLLAAWLSKSKSWLHIQDFELDTAFNLGMLPGGKVIYPLARWFEKSILTRFDHVSTISENMLKLCVQKGVLPEHASLLPNWVDTKAIYPMQAVNLLWEEPCLPVDQIIVLYHGNMGRKQGLEILLDSAEILRNEMKITFVLCGEGIMRRELELRACRMSNVRFLGLQPEARLNELVNLADIHVLPQLAGAADLGMPSKLGGMCASGKVVIACAEPNTQLGQMVGACGRLVPPGDADQLAKAILELSGNENLRNKLGNLGRAYAVSKMDRREILNQFAVKLNDMLSEKREKQNL
jgi:colanic acid biosynthesis glycosyl transferase WcaI